MLGRFLCWAGQHRWSDWSWGRWERLASSSYRRICLRPSCGTEQRKGLLAMMTLDTRNIQRFDVDSHPVKILSGKSDDDE